MRVIYLTFLAGLILLFGASKAFASSAKEIRITLESGRYDLAIEQGSALGTADGFVLAAEALNAKLLLGKADKKTKTAKKAMKLAQAALALEPNNAEAQLQYALAYGFYGRHASTFKAWRKNLPTKILAEIDKAAIMAPNDSRIDALKGAWHLTLLYRANGFDMEKRYGANAVIGKAFFQKALAQNNDDIILRANSLMLEYVLAPEELSAKTKLALGNTLLPLKPRNAVEQQVLEQMQAVYMGFETGDALRQAEKFVTQ